MLKEIYEQPRTIENALRGRIDHKNATAKFGGLNLSQAELHSIDRIIIAASGTSWHAALVGEYLIEEFAGIPVEVEFAHEFCYRNAPLEKNTVLLVLSQSGETADTLAALREAKRRGHPTIAVTNVHNSTMAREATVDLATLAGVELAIPATKSFTTQLALIVILALLAARERRTLSDDDIEERLEALAGVSTAVAAQLPGWERTIAALAPMYADARTFLYLGRGVHYAIAREGALKLKESSYLHAEGYPSGELKHGPNALVSPEVPLVVLATVDTDDPESMLRYEKTVSLLYDMREQGARVLALANAGDATIPSLASHTIAIEPASEALLPISEVIPLQLFAYFMAVHHGVDVDRPRNLSKAVTTE
jgi:glucosamine--fructose-6-phosphate aminotransferase (isomerizing)